MAIVTDARVFYRKSEILADCWGNNVAILCPVCGVHPVLLIARTHQKGSASDSPRHCRNCRAAVFIKNDIPRRGKFSELTIESRKSAQKKSKI